MPHVIYEKKGHIAYITLNRPERLNALGTELSQQLREAEIKVMTLSRLLSDTS